MKINKFKLFKYYKNFPEPVKASIWFTITNFVQKGIVFITIPIFTRILSLEEFGLYNLYITWMAVFSVFATLNLSTGGFNNAMIRYEKDKDKFLSSMVGLTALTNITVLIIYLLISSVFGLKVNLPLPFINVLFIETFFSAVYSLWSQRLKFDFRYKPVIIYILLYSTLSTILGIIAVIYFKTAISRVYANILILSILGLFLLFLIILKSKSLYNKAFWKFALVFNIPLIPHYLSQIILSQSDRIMISYFQGEAYTAIYSVAYSVSMILVVLSSSISSSLNPWIFQRLKEKSYLSIRRISTISILLFSLLVITPVLIGPEIISFMGPSDYIDAIWVIPSVSLSVFFIFLYSLFASIEFYFNKRKYISVGSFIVAITNIVLNIVFIPMFGFIAAGYTTLICYAAYSLVHYFFMQKIIKTELNGIKIFNKKILIAITIGLTLITTIFLMIYKYSIIRYIILLVFLTLIIVFWKKILGSLKWIWKMEERNEF